jgi:uncharacterized HAD superfamily protein
VAAVTLGLDIDGVVADFITPFLRLLQARSGGAPIDPASIIDPNFMQHPFLTRELIFECMETVSYDPEFWSAMTPLLSSAQWQRLDQLSRDHDVVFITHRWVRDTYDIHRITCDWLRRHGLTRPVVHFTQEKKSALIRKLGIELFVDDRHENCHDAAAETDAVVLMPHRPYNQAFDHPKVRRIREFDEVWDHLK